MEPSWRDRKEIDGYRILHGNDVEIDLENDLIIPEINGASIKDQGLQVSIKLNQRLTNIDGYDIGNWTIVFKQGYKMGQVLDSVPYGIIDKSITGIGATTLEINTELRSSIIVVPTKALAYNKYKTTNNARGENYCMYIGSSIGDIAKDITIDHVREYIASRGESVRKFVVVADSLPMLLDFLKILDEEVYRDYFLMVDEVDTMQADSAYRPRLETVMDYYFRFKFYNRAVITATMSEFSNPKLENEARVRIEWEVNPRRTISTLFTTYVDDLAWNEINLLLETDDNKILVAYNSLDGIANIIKHLSIPSSDCGILCSERSIEKAQLYIEDAHKSIDSNGHLIKRVTFMTCAYFAGIDIMDKCHLITVTSKLQPFTYLSLNRMTQIAGRCRKGTFSETIIYDIPEISPKSEIKEVNDYRLSLINRANKYAALLNDIVSATDEDPQLLPLKDFVFSYTDFVSKVKATNANYPLTIVRQESETDKFVPAYFNIDSITEVWNLRHSIYSSREEFIDSLRVEGHNITELPDALLSKQEHDTSEIQQIKLLNKEKFYDSFQQLRVQLKEWEEQGCNEYHLKEIRRNTDKRLQQTALDTFVLLYPYIPSAELLEKLEDVIDNERKLRNFINAAVFYALPIAHPFKASLIVSFGINVKTEEGSIGVNLRDRIKTIREVFMSIYNYELSVDKAVVSDLYNSFFDWKRSGRGDKVRNMNPRGFHQLKASLPIDANLLTLLRFPK